MSEHPSSKEQLRESYVRQLREWCGQGGSTPFPLGLAQAIESFLARTAPEPPGVHPAAIAGIAVKNGQAVVIGIPAQYPHLPDDHPWHHNCDAMGCSSVEHFLWRGPVQDESTAQPPETDQCQRADGAPELLRGTGGGSSPPSWPAQPPFAADLQGAIQELYYAKECITAGAMRAHLTNALLTLGKLVHTPPPGAWRMSGYETVAGFNLVVQGPKGESACFEVDIPHDSVRAEVFKRWLGLTKCAAQPFPCGRCGRELDWAKDGEVVCECGAAYRQTYTAPGEGAAQS